MLDVAPPDVSICPLAFWRRGGWWVRWRFVERTRGRMSGNGIVLVGWLDACASNGRHALPFIDTG